MLSQMAVFHLFLQLSNKYSIIYVYHIFIQSSIKGYFCCFCILATMNNVAVNIGVHIKFSLYLEFSCFLCYSPISICKVTGSSGWVFLLMLLPHTVGKKLDSVLIYFRAFTTCIQNDYLGIHEQHNFNTLRGKNKSIPFLCSLHRT
ncbi:hypothetical protein HJG60_010255 [Phyllostomus discolor]|uniref:Uncharacterized protein n=1 Tax=Phyllostomus discolor TaxID=89673 RepID=A0A834EMR7_9CHIR|nr:hypothetical protein HJG60_010255 [Phyllostomus discolor]